MTLDEAIEKLEKLRKVNGGNISLGIVTEDQDQNFEIDFFEALDIFGGECIIIA